MKDEIKEILEALKHYDFSLDVPEKVEIMINKVLNYITNLQEELKSAKESISWWQNRFNAVEKENKKLKNRNEFLEKVCVGFDDKYENYKTRCEKAIEYNQQIIKDTKDFYRPTEDIIYSGDTLIDIAMNNINILQGGFNE